ncbi:MAG: NUDIX domain-containing protein, partial [Egibacteraceae bacterium]
LQGSRRVAAGSASAAAALSQAGVPADPVAPEDLEPAAWEAVALLDDELSYAGGHAEGLLARVADSVLGGGLVAVTALGTVHHRARGRDLEPVRGWTAEELRRALGHFGFDAELLSSPGAAATVAGDPDGPSDPELDRRPGLLDAGPRLLAVGRRAVAPSDRTQRFLSTLPRKVVAAAVLCRDPDGRLLVVHDAFKRHWTIPGGVVDPDEDPRSAAVREAREESGVAVTAGAVLGVFSAPWPDRLVLVYEATPDGGADPEPLHAHEIDAVAWLPLAEALQRLAPSVAWQVRRCLNQPGGTWRQDLHL